MSDSEIVITYQSERYVWYIQRGDATTMISAQDMVNEYHRWYRTGRLGEWRHNAFAFCRTRLEQSAQRPAAPPGK
jgi:hypothetical protein